MSKKIAPGLYEAMPEADYHALAYASKHSLDVIRESSPAHLRYQREHPKTPTPAMKLGSALHTSVLEPQLFPARHPVASQCAAILSSGKNAGGRCKNDGAAMIEGEWFCGTHLKGNGHLASDVPGAISASDWECIEGMRKAILSHPSAVQILNAHGPNEHVAIWDREIDGLGVRCKLRADAFRPKLATVLDIKTCECASRDECEKAIFNLGYLRQSAWYQDGYLAHGIAVEHFVFCFCEKSPPYGVAVYRLLDEVIQLGREENDRLVKVYAKCERSGEWPCYGDEVRDVGIPKWAFHRSMEALK